MTQSKSGAAKSVEDSQEIDRIIQEIEQMEKSIDQVEAQTPEPAKVVPIRAAEATPSSATDVTETSASEATALDGESEGVEAPSSTVSDPIGFDKVLKAATERAATSTSPGEGDLSLSVGGCSTITLEFGRAGSRVTLSCDDDQLTITTDTGAEFRVPFRKTA